MIEYVTDSILYAGANDHEVDLFEGQYAVPNGMAYNSYVILDESVAVMDAIDKSKTQEWLSNLEQALGGRQPDYLVILHMEPDHSASIGAFLEKYPQATVVSNAKAFGMIGQFFPGLVPDHTLQVKDGETLSLGRHSLTFLMAPMVHWPEVMMAYEAQEKVLFSADAFGKFGALDAGEEWAAEARRYYFGIVGKYGMQVQGVLKKAAGLDLKILCPLHGPVLKENLGDYLNLYDIWSGYRPEREGVCICYASAYGNTKAAALRLRDQLAEAGTEVVCHDLARCDQAQAVADAFRYDRLVLASITYNGDVFPFMKTYIAALLERNYQNRTLAVIENGSWGPLAARLIRASFEKSKNIVFAQQTVTLKSALSPESEAQLAALAEELKK